MSILYFERFFIMGFEKWGFEKLVFINWVPANDLCLRTPLKTCEGRLAGAGYARIYAKI
jgi:hypothetical protein